MPWKETNPVSERMRFVVRMEQGERMADLCREFGISRKTGYKIWNRFHDTGPPGLEDQSRVAHRHPHRTPETIRSAVIAFRRAHPTWGPKKLKFELEKRNQGVSFPAKSTIGQIIDESGLVKKRWRRNSMPSYPQGLRKSEAPNDVWCADFKGQFRLGNHDYCYPLTITDHLSRYLLGCEALDKPEGVGSRNAFEEVFKEYGIPYAIRTDNGTPFASSRTFAGLSRLSVWWIKLGIIPERIEPGHPEQNGRHERFHLTLKQDTARPAKANMLQQQERFDEFREEYNTARPHEALDMKYPSDIYKPSRRPYIEPELEYPLHDKTHRVSSSGHIHFGRHKEFFLTSALAEEEVGLREIEDGLWLVTFAQLNLGHLDFRRRCFEPFEELDFSTIGEQANE